jgi:hypothetical protein
VNGVIGVFEAREEKEARMDSVPSLMTPKAYYILITFFFFFFIKFLLKSEHILEHLGEKYPWRLCDQVFG